MTEGIRFQRPTLPAGEAIERYLQLSRAERWFSNSGPCSELMRARLTDITGRPCVLVANATLGLIVSLAAVASRARVAARDVLVPSFAFAASAQSAVWNQLRPVFVDVDPDHWHLAPDALEAALDTRQGHVAAVVALSSFGTPPPPAVRKRWEALCADAGVALVVDSAAGFGAKAEDGVPIGAQGDVEVVSFHALKPLSAGEGGAVFCRHEALAEEVARIANFAFDDDHVVTRADALNAKLSEPAAAIALASLDELETSLASRCERAVEILDRLPENFQRQVGYTRGTWQFVPVAAPDAAARTAVLREAEQRRIGLRTYYDPLHLMPAFADCERADELEVTETLACRMLSLPMATDLEPSEIAAIADLVRAGSHASVYT